MLILPITPILHARGHTMTTRKKPHPQAKPGSKLGHHQVDALLDALNNLPPITSFDHHFYSLCKARYGRPRDSDGYRSIHPERAKRQCLKCRVTFMSNDRGNRLCASCGNLNARASARMEDPGISFSKGKGVDRHA